MRIAFTEREGARTMADTNRPAHAHAQRPQSPHSNLRAPLSLPLHPCTRTTQQPEPSQSSTVNHGITTIVLPYVLKTPPPLRNRSRESPALLSPSGSPTLRAAQIDNSWLSSPTKTPRSTQPIRRETSRDHLPSTPEKHKKTSLDLISLSATPASILPIRNRSNPLPMRPATPRQAEQDTSTIPNPPPTPVKAVRRRVVVKMADIEMVMGENDEGTAAYQAGAGESAMSSPMIVQAVPVPDIEPLLPQIPNPRLVQKFQIGQEVFLLDSRGNSTICSDTINPAHMHMSMLSFENPNSVGNTYNPHQMDTPDVFIIERRLRWFSENGQPPPDDGAWLLYKLIPRDGYGEEKMVSLSYCLIQVRFKPGDTVIYLKKGVANHHVTKLEALVRGAEVVGRKRVYTVYLWATETVVLQVHDEDLEDVDEYLRQEGQGHQELEG
ncbi:hypothetical protein ABEF93_003039 [Exophiala dermatitidis]